MPMSGFLATLEHALALVAGHRLVVELLLGARVVEVVVDHLVAEQLAGDGARLEPPDRLTQRVREALGVGGVGVALEGGPELQLVLDPVQAAGEQRGEGEIRVRVGAGDPRFRPHRGAVADEPEAARAVVVAPGERGRRPAPRREALVRVDRRRDEDREVRHAGDLAGEVVAEELRLAREGVLALAPERGVDVARRADPVVVRLRHEGDRAVALERDLLDPGLVDDVIVGGAQRVLEAEVDLVLAGPGLALGRLHDHPGRLHRRSHLAQEGLVEARGEDVVVEDVRHRRREVVVVLAVRLGVALAEEEELELRAEHRIEAERAGLLDLCLEHLPWGGADRCSVVPVHVALHHHCRLVPRDAAQGRKVGGEGKVAVAALPARDRVPGHGIHLHLEREQVVAAFPAVPGCLFGEEELRVEPLAHEAALQVGEAGDHRVDGARGDVFPQLLERQHPRRHYTGRLGRLQRPAHPVSFASHAAIEGGGHVSSAAPSGVHDDDTAHLHRLGYAQELFRSMGGFQNFAISFTIISILAGCLTSYYIGYSQGGPVAITWGWLIVGLMCTFVALALGEIASTYPTAGGLYYWSSKLGSPGWGWFTGWVNLIGQIAVTAAIGFGCAILMTSLFNLWWSYPNPSGWIYFLYGLIILGAGLINMFKVSITAVLNSFSAWWHMIGVVVLVAIMIIVPDHHHSFSYVSGQTINNTCLGATT